MKKIKIAISFIFIIFIFGLSAGSILLKDKDFSENENRVLASFPEFSWERVKSGDFQSDLETYLSDQVIGRDDWITVKTALQKSTGDTDIGGAYLGKEGYDFEKILPEDVDDKQVAKNTDSVEEYFEICSQYLSKDNIYFMLVPTSGLVNSDQLPKGARLFDQDKYIDQIQASITTGQVIDVRESLLDSESQYLYYKTDHHWTSLGAAMAYKTWCQDKGIDFDSTQVGQALKSEDSGQVQTSKFRGSLYSKILNADSAYDTIWTLTDDSDYSVVADGKDLGGIYQEDKLDTKDKYAYFFGGNYGEVCVTNNSGKGQGTLLVIKDSFANTFVPLIAENYDKIYMIDLRYFSGDMTEYLTNQDITDVMVLYNISNFISDKNLFKLVTN